MSPWSTLRPLARPPAAYLVRMAKASSRLHARWRALERGVVATNSRARFRVAIGYPAPYGVGMTGLALHKLHALATSDPRWRVERFFPEGPGVAPTTIESDTPIAKFDVIALSCSFELDYIPIVRMLYDAGLLDLPRDQRPLLLLGGIAPTLNPTPLSELFDGIFVGEADEAFVEMLDVVADALRRGGRKQAVCEALAEVEGLYVPSVHGMSSPHPRPFPMRREDVAQGREQDEAARIEPAPQHPRSEDAPLPASPPRDGDDVARGEGQDSGAPTRLAPLPARSEGEGSGEGLPLTIHKRYFTALDESPTYSAIITPESHFGNMFLVETGRGCPQGCRFCAVGFAYLPNRYYSKATILGAVDAHRQGATRIGLVGSAVLGHPDMLSIMDELTRAGMSIHPASLRVSALSDAVLDVLRRSGTQSLTLAPEVATDRMRRIVHKEVRDEVWLDTLTRAAKLGFRKVKLYFLVGLPGERWEDVDRIRDWMLELRAALPQEMQLSVGLNPFQPKPETPFLWAPMETEPLLREKIARVRDGLEGVRGIRVAGYSQREATLAGLFSLGDARVLTAIRAMVVEGRSLRQALDAAGLDIARILYSEKPRDATWPFSFVTTALKPSRLYRQM